MPNMNSIGFKTNELLMFHSGCHGNQVSIVTRYVADVYCPNEPHTKIGTQYGLRQKSYKAKCI